MSGRILPDMVKRETLERARTLAAELRETTEALSAALRTVEAVLAERYPMVIVSVPLGEKGGRLVFNRGQLQYASRPGPNQSRSPLLSVSREYRLLAVAALPSLIAALDEAPP